MRPRPLLAALAALALASPTMLAKLRAALSAPVINDVATDTEDAPRFDDGKPLPESFAAAIKAAYPNLSPLTLSGTTPASAHVVAVTAAGQMAGWEVVKSDAASLSLTAVATTALLRFKDDIVVRVQPAAKGPGSVVDVRVRREVFGGWRRAGRSGSVFSPPFFTPQTPSVALPPRQRRPGGQRGPRPGILEKGGGGGGGPVRERGGDGLFFLETILFAHKHQRKREGREKREQPFQTAHNTVRARRDRQGHRALCEGGTKSHPPQHTLSSHSSLVRFLLLFGRVVLGLLARLLGGQRFALVAAGAAATERR